MRFAQPNKMANFLGTKADFAGMGMTAVQDSAENFANSALNNARAADARMASEAKIASAEHWADATRAAGQAQGQAAAVGGLASGIGGLGGMFKGGGLFGGGGSGWNGTAGSVPSSWTTAPSGINTSFGGF